MPGMATDTHAAAEFYASARGGVAARLLRERLTLIWPSVAGQAVLGLGYAAPYLRLWREDAARCIALMPAQIGAARWPAGSPCLSCTAEEDSLPFADMSFDRILVVHGLEAAENARKLLRELWRVLKDDGRLLIVTPNRSGMWAHLEATPFGQGQPYSPGQIGRLLAGAMFRVERRDTALYVPPSRLRVILRAAPLIERSGRRLLPGLAGVTLTEASKDAFAVLPLQPAPRRRLVLVEVG
jgi:SAM-dependent methyltransferase